MGGSWQRFRLLSCRIKAAVLRARGGEGRPAGREVDRADHIEPCLFGSRREQKPIALPANREAEPVLPRPTPLPPRCGAQICSTCVAHCGLAPCCSRSGSSGSPGGAAPAKVSLLWSEDACAELSDCEEDVRPGGPPLPAHHHHHRQCSFSHLNPTPERRKRRRRKKGWVPPRCRKRWRRRKSPRRRWKATTTSCRPAPSWRALCSVSRRHADQFQPTSPPASPAGSAGRGTICCSSYFIEQLRDCSNLGFCCSTF